MSFVLEAISEENKKKILSDCDESQSIALGRRGGYFAMNPGIMWAHDVESGNYLHCAPSIDYVSAERCYYFCFEAKIYVLRIASPASNLVEFVGDVNLSQDRFEQLKNQISEAFLVYGRSNGSGAPKRVVFKGGE